MTKAQTKNAIQTKRLTREQRQDFYRSIYLGLGSDRSIRRVKEFCDEHMQGDAPKLPTLARYSQDFGWVETAKAFDEERGGATQYTHEAWTAALDMDGRHAKLGQALQSRAAEALGVLNVRDVGGAAIGSMAERGVRIERVAAGAVTERVEITIESINGVLDGVMQEFGAVLEQFSVLTEADREYARKLFGNRVDDIAHRYLATRGIELPTVAQLEAGPEPEDE